ncbi:hypothetical protein QTO34_004630 [Cnephaeus nilssonii]|uniref:Uncharacterized protein n=1 Tax=Cnephaeus nilssonii TaxID=3371016 RepID=A0AA40LKK0_CNENI|nr:hypothetical protein QTO34_004630 [Eptesicus nilssonii]
MAWSLRPHQPPRSVRFVRGAPPSRAALQQQVPLAPVHGSAVARQELALAKRWRALAVVVKPFHRVIVSYTYIISTILKIPTASGRRKAFSTCASHFTFVVLGYGSCLFLYVKPNQRQAAQYNKIASLVIAVVTPFLNPFIFTLRNDKVKEALRDIARQELALAKRWRALAVVVKPFHREMVLQMSAEDTWGLADFCFAEWSRMVSMVGLDRGLQAMTHPQAELDGGPQGALPNLVLG